LPLEAATTVILDSSLQVFIYKALYNSGAVALQKDKTLDYEWLVLDEMLPAVDHRVAGSLRDMLYNDDP
jgi:hypothetical protein